MIGGEARSGVILAGAWNLELDFRGGRGSPSPTLKKLLKFYHRKPARRESGKKEIITITKLRKL